MAFWDKLAEGGAKGLIGGVGEFVKDVRTAITGKEVLTGEQIALLDAQSKALEAALINADVLLAQGQMDINKIEAQSTSFFKSGWRPAVGWVCVVGLAYQFIGRPLLPWILDACMYTVKDLPSLDMGSLLTLLGGLLGLGGLRTFEKYKGVATK
jgi:hypothetical protein